MRTYHLTPAVKSYFSKRGFIDETEKSMNYPEPGNHVEYSHKEEPKTPFRDRIFTFKAKMKEKESLETPKKKKKKGERKPNFGRIEKMFNEMGFTPE
jgi:hypothetical protein